MSLYYCGESGCKGHHSFSETCSSVVKVVDDYAGLVPFIQGIGEEETQPFVPIKSNDADKARGQVTQEMKAYNNKAALPVAQKARTG
ncbi:MAG: hypothetical protein ABI690_20935 [Chloroflexota bacterium]